MVGFVGAAALAFMLVSVSPDCAEGAARQAPADTIESGRETYLFYCAPCHGRDGKGDGPVAPALKLRPADVTAISKRRGGTFPEQEMMALLIGKGRLTPAHGSSDMPVWGPLFRQINPFDSRIDIRLNRLIDYLESLQVK